MSRSSDQSENKAQQVEKAGKLYLCRNERYGEVYEKGILIKVSLDLGHNRCDVVVNHYMK